MSEKLACVILAAGKGSRMKSSKPKVMHELAGRPLVGWILNTVGKLEPEKVVVVTGRDDDGVRDYLCDNIEAVVQDPPLGTADAVKAALPALKGFEGIVLVLLGDGPLYTEQTLRRMKHSLKGQDVSDMIFLAMRPDDPTGYGRMLIDSDGFLKRIVEEKDADEAQKATNLCWTGVMAVRASRLKGWLAKVDNKNEKGEYYLTKLPEIAAEEGARTYFIESPIEETLGANSKADLAVLEIRMQDRLRLRALENGVTLRDPASTYFSWDTDIAPDVTIEPHVVFGPGVKIEAGVHIRAFSHIEGAHIKSGATVGPFARLRPKTVLGEDVQIGTFVEVSKTTVGRGSKAMHQSYLGMATIGEDCNIGAGTITCNYDGVNKHETTLGDNVFIGSNTNLVAPVTIHDGAFTAAGSTITTDVPEESLGIARSKQKIFEGWAKSRQKKKA